MGRLNFDRLFSKVPGRRKRSTLQLPRRHSHGLRRVPEAPLLHLGERETVPVCRRRCLLARRLQDPRPDRVPVLDRRAAGGPVLCSSVPEPPLHRGCGTGREVVFLAWSVDHLPRRWHLVPAASVPREQGDWMLGKILRRFL